MYQNPIRQTISVIDNKAKTPYCSKLKLNRLKTAITIIKAKYEAKKATNSHEINFCMIVYFESE